MADVSKIKLPNNIVYDIKDVNAAKIGVVEYGVSTYQEVLEAYENNDTVICTETQSSSSSGAVDIQGYFIIDTAFLIHPPDPFFEFYNNSSIVKITYGDVWSKYSIRRVTSVGIQNQTNGGLSVSDSPITSQGTISIGHSNVLSSAQTTSGIYPIKIDKNGHISEYGSAVTIPTKVSDLTNDSGYITGYTETDPTVPSWAKAANKPSYNAEEIALDSPWTYDGNVISTTEEALNYLDDNKLSSETDPVFTASAAYGISSSDITNWNSKTSNVGTITSVKTTAGAHSTIDISSGAVTFNVPTTAAHVGAVADCTLQIYNGQGGNPGVVKFLTVDYSTCGSENGALIKVTMMAGHGNGSSYNHYQDAIISVTYTGAVSVNIYRYYAQSITYSGAAHYYGDILYTVDTTNKIVKFYDLMGQYSYMKQSPFKRMNGSSGGVITQHTSASYDLSGTGTFANVFWLDGSTKQNTLISGTNIKTINGSSVLGSGDLTVSASTNFSGDTFYSGDSDTAEHNANNAIKNGVYYYTSNGPAQSLGATTNDGSLHVQQYSDTWVTQIAQDYRNGCAFVRGKNNGTWTAWQRVFDTGHSIESGKPAKFTDTITVADATIGTLNVTGYASIPGYLSSDSIQYSMTDLTAGSSPLTTGSIYFVYE